MRDTLHQVLKRVLGLVLLKIHRINNEDFMYERKHHMLHIQDMSELNIYNIIFDKQHITTEHVFFKS